MISPQTNNIQIQNTVVEHVDESNERMDSYDCDRTGLGLRTGSRPGTSESRKENGLGNKSSTPTIQSIEGIRADRRQWHQS